MRGILRYSVQDNTPGTPTILCGNYTIQKMK